MNRCFSRNLLDAYCRRRLALGFGAGLLTTGIASPLLAQSPPASAVRPLVFVSTNDPISFRTVRSNPRYPSRFSNVVGSGGLLLNANHEVVAYYLTVSDLNLGTPYAYHFHAARAGGKQTSCEGDKGLVDSEAPGAVILDLGTIAPLQPSTRGFAFLGSPQNPIGLPNPVPLSAIGYLNIHPAPDGAVSPGVICANVRLNPGGFDNSRR